MPKETLTSRLAGPANSLGKLPDTPQEIMVYLPLEQHFGKQGVELADRDRAEHQMAPGTDEYNEWLNKTMKILREHVKSEAQEELPVLEPLNFCQHGAISV